MHFNKEDINIFMFIKFTVAVAIMVALPITPAIMTLIFVAVGYRHVVAKIYGLHVMPIMDLNCFYSSDEGWPNIIYFNQMTDLKIDDFKE